MRRIFVLIAAVVSIVILSSCMDPPATVTGVITKVIYKQSTTLDGASWNAGLKLKDGRTIELSTSSDEDNLAAKVSKGSCVRVIGTDGSGDYDIGNASNLQVLPDSSCKGIEAAASPHSASGAAITAAPSGPTYLTKTAHQPTFTT